MMLRVDITPPPKLAIVVPCYNEEEVLTETISRLSDLLRHLIDTKKCASDGTGIYFVDDGSKDHTWQLIEDHAETNSIVHGIKLSRNRGHQSALLAGLFSAPGEAIISIDADLQDDLGAIELMLDAYLAGHDIVYGVRDNRESDTFFKRFTAEGYYRLMRAMGVDLVFNHADFRLMSRRAIDSLEKYDEVNLFLRGIVPQLGYSSTCVRYSRSARFAGESKYPFRKMLALAIDGITSFSTVPLRIITIAGIILALFSILAGCWALTVRLNGSYVPGWASIVIPSFFLGGVQLLSIGIIGEYLAKIYTEVKHRPRFIIDKQI